MFDTLKQHITHEPTQKEQLTGTVANNAGGYSFQVTDWQALRRFLLLGTTGGTYYVSQKDLTKQNIESLEACLKENGARFVQEVCDISRAGRAQKNDAAIFALAVAAAKGDESTKALAAASIPTVCRTFTHLSRFVTFVRQGKMRGWGRGLKRGIATWFNGKTIDSLAYQAIKYGSRDGYAQRDVYRLAHPAQFLGGINSVEPQRRALYSYIAKGTVPIEPIEAPEPSKGLQQIVAAESIKNLDLTEDGVLYAIRNFHLPMEAVPTERRSASVYRAIVESKPGITWLIRNLASMTGKDMFEDNDFINLVVSQLTDGEQLKRGRVHPLTVFLALNTYKSGKSFKGKSTWTPKTKIIDALSDAFYLSFGNLEPIKGNVLLAIDISGSMHVQLPEFNCMLPEICAVMAMVVAKAAENYTVIGYHTTWRELNISHKQRLDDVIRSMPRDPQYTDCAVPFAYAMTNKKKFDLILSFTDSETWAGPRHPITVFDEYKRTVYGPAKAINVAMVANHVSTLPGRPDCLEVVGFDSSLPQLIANFTEDISGEVTVKTVDLSE